MEKFDQFSTSFDHFFTKFLIIALSHYSNSKKKKKKYPKKKREKEKHPPIIRLKNDSPLPNPLAPFSKRIRPGSISCFQLFSTIIRCLSIGVDE